MILRLAVSLITCGIFGAATAAPYCPDMLDEDKLETRYHKQAPIYNDDQTGWIIGDNQLGINHRIDVKTAVLMADLVAELKHHGTDLAIMIAPPRPVIAGQNVVDATTGRPGLYDVRRQEFYFWHMVNQLRASGALVANLQKVALSNSQIRGSYYFHRDTHWTNIGAAHSVIAVAQAASRTAELEFDDLPVVSTYQERGSLSDIVGNTCGNHPDPETSVLFDYSSNSGLGLLDDAPEVTVALVGTSFSDRYGQDSYQVSDAFASVLGTGVVNHSVSGGGMVGPLETYVLSGQFAEERPKLLVWEFPYTYVIRERHLRQILGAMRAERATEVSRHTLALDDSEAELSVDLSGIDADLISLRMDQPGDLKVEITLDFPNGASVSIPIKRNRRTEKVAVLDTWWADISRLPSQGVAKVSLHMPGDHAATAIDVGFHRAHRTE